MSGEPDRDELEQRFGVDNNRIYSGVAHWEAALAIARKRKTSIAAAHAAVARFAGDFGIEMVPIGAVEASVAIDAHQRYGKGTKHRARLNMGDCFAYACARTNDAKLLYKGDDFIHTDLA